MEFHGGSPAELSVHEELTARRRRHDAELGPTGEIEIGWRLAGALGPGVCQKGPCYRLDL
jgi:hypothetical protein